MAQHPPASILVVDDEIAMQQGVRLALSNCLEVGLAGGKWLSLKRSND
jgi:hypothetical protein